ncbi:MAG: cysteine desulfurase family protein [Bacteroidia bacterium]
MKVYFDNAATTPLIPEVIDAMLPVLQHQFGNPSSIHAYGRETRAAIEMARKKVAGLLKAAPSEIFFTSGGTEADNMAVRCSVHDLGIKHIITSPIEHHAVLHTAEDMAHRGEITLSLVRVDEKGHVDLEHLETLLKENERSLVSLMHANNEIGTLLPLQQVGVLCHKYNALFHCDTVQTMGHYYHDLSALEVDFITGAAHKFHGPKGVGFLYISSNVKIKPLITGGAQERNMRGGTENVYGIVGLAKALEICYANMEEDIRKVSDLKSYMIGKLRAEIPGVDFNGDVEEGNSLYTVLNVSFPPTDHSEMLLFNLDIAGIACSAGSACSSGSNVGSHVLTAIGSSPDRPAIRFSFSRYNTREEVDFCISKVKELFLVKA